MLFSLIFNKYIFCLFIILFLKKYFNFCYLVLFGFIIIIVLVFVFYLFVCFFIVYKDFFIYSKFSLDFESPDSLAGLLEISFFNCFGIECGIRSGDGIWDPTSFGLETPALERA